jgi:hypothetical protein
MSSYGPITLGCNDYELIRQAIKEEDIKSGERPKEDTFDKLMKKSGADLSKLEFALDSLKKYRV